MINHFIWGEILLYATILGGIYYFPRWQKSPFPVVWGFPLDAYVMSLPLLISLMYAFSSLIFTYSLLPLIFFLTTFAVFVDLYDYLRRVAVFEIKAYLQQGVRVIFLCFLAFLTSLVILRIYTYFIL